MQLLVVLVFCVCVTIAQERGSDSKDEENGVREGAADDEESEHGISTRLVRPPRSPGRGGVRPHKNPARSAVKRPSRELARGSARGSAKRPLRGPARVSVKGPNRGSARWSARGSARESAKGSSGRPHVKRLNQKRPVKLSANPRSKNRRMWRI